MKAGIGSVGLMLPLILSILGISGSADANRATAMAGATVVAPVSVDETLIPRSTGLFVSGVTGDLIIRPGASISGTDADSLRSVLARLQVRVDNSCTGRAMALSDCLRVADQQGFLDGDPVSTIMLNVTADDPAGKGGVGVIVSYN